MGSIEPLSPEASATLEALRRESPWAFRGVPLLLLPEQVQKLAAPLGLREGIDYLVRTPAPGRQFAIVRGFPPNIDEIDRVFDVRHRPIIYAWGDTIYASNGAVVDDAKIAHESVHMARQGGDVAGWWGRYLADRSFRLAEEAAAHVAEYLFLCERFPGRAARRQALAQNAAALSSGLYGNLISSSEARAMLRAAAEAVEATQKEPRREPSDVGPASRGV